MPIPQPAATAEQYRTLLAKFTLGSPIAEDDDLLGDSRIETPAFGELVRAEIDIIRGTKGSGKSALYRIFTNFLSTHLLSDMRILLIKGVEATGDPVFAKYRPQFEQLDEIDFQNFWRIYFLSLINNQLLRDAPGSSL